MEVRSAFFWDLTQGKMAVSHRRFGLPISPNFMVEDKTDMDRNVDAALPF